MVKMSEQKSMAPDSSLASKGFNINPLDILRFLLSKWYWFVLSVSLFGGWAWYKYSTTQFRYSTNATVMFKDARATAREAGLDRLANAAPQVNISNEILQFRSPELMRKAVLRLHAEVDYTVMDYLRVEELYSNSPIKVSFLDVPDDQVATLQVTPIDDQKVRLSGFTSDGPLTAPLGKIVRTPLGKLSITKTLFYSKEWYGRTINVKKNDIGVTVVPAFFLSAGARLTVTRLTGNSRPQFLMEARTRSRASRTAASGRPTTSNWGSPPER